jgi:hypothetical protein
MQTLAYGLIGFIVFFSAFFSIEQIYLKNEEKVIYSVIRSGHIVDSLKTAIEMYGVKNIHFKTAVTDKLTGIVTHWEQFPISTVLTNKNNETAYSLALEHKVKFGDSAQLFIVTLDGNERIQIV